MLRIPEHLREYVDIEEVTGKLLVADKIPKEYELEVGLIKQSYDMITDSDELTEY